MGVKLIDIHLFVEKGSFTSRSLERSFRRLNEMNNSKDPRKR